MEESPLFSIASPNQFARGEHRGEGGGGGGGRGGGERGGNRGGGRGEGGQSCHHMYTAKSSGDSL